MSSLHEPILPGHPLSAASALAQFATEHHAPAALVRGGPYQRALNLTDRGASIADASRIASAQGKGHVGELLQSAQYSAASGALSRPHRARPNKIANDPRVDVEVMRGKRRKLGAQVKVGSPNYVRRALRAGKYEHLIVNVEALDVLGDEAGDAFDHLDHRGTSAPQLVASECEELASTALARMLRGDEALGTIEMLASAARAGLHDGLTNFALNLVGSLVDAISTSRAFDPKREIASALRGAVRAAARTSVETTILLSRFVSRARSAFSSRLVHRLARSRVAVSAVAEVVVEVAVDLVEVLRKRMTFEDLLRRLGVHVTTAAGSALGVAAAYKLTRGMPWWVSGLAALFAGYAGARLGRAVGEKLFIPAAEPARLIAATAS